MKKKVIFAFMAFFAPTLVWAQHNITSDGKVSIGTTLMPVSTFAVGGAGETESTSAFDGKIQTVRVHGQGNPLDYKSIWGTGLYVREEVNSTMRGDVGIRVYTEGATNQSSGRAIGVSATAGNSTSGYNYGVVGNLYGSQNGTGVLGVLGNPNGVYIDGRYAGYFQGNVKVTGTINGTLISNSDIRYKSNVREFSKTDDNVLSKIDELIPVSYNYKHVDFEPVNDTTKITDKPLEYSVLAQKEHYGFVAQDLQKVYPELVYEDSNGYLSINYTELIPILVQSIKELNEKVKDLSNGVEKRELGESMMEVASVLYQNTPNPFTEATEIRYQLPSNTVNACIYIFDIQGALLQQVPIDVAQGSVRINKGILKPGMYVYSLIANGKAVDTKRMILSN